MGAVAIVVENCEIILLSILVMMASNDIVEPELDNLMSSMMAMYMVHKKWTVLVTV